MEDQRANNGGNNSNPSNVASINQKVHLPCPGCGDRLYVDNPELELFNTLHISQIIAAHKPVTCKKCGRQFISAINPQETKVNWMLLEVEKPKEEPLIIVPSIDPSKLKLT